jgi:hypothetical protein
MAIMGIKETREGKRSSRGKTECPRNKDKGARIKGK